MKYVTECLINLLITALISSVFGWAIYKFTDTAPLEALWAGSLLAVLVEMIFMSIGWVYRKYGGCG